LFFVGFARTPAPPKPACRAKPACGLTQKKRFFGLRAHLQNRRSTPLARNVGRGAKHPRRRASAAAHKKKENFLRRPMEPV
jgi:hypothetical protein